MEYDFRNNRTGGPPPYTTQSTAYNNRPQPSYGGQSAVALYPKIGGQHHPPNRIPPSFHPNPSPSSSSSSSPGVGIRVAIKPEYRITPPPQLSPIREIPRSTFQFDFDFERKILAEAEKENPNWSKFVQENLPLRTAESIPHVSSSVDPVVNKYLSMGLSREAVPLAVANFGDNPTKVREFAEGYVTLREMGFKSDSVAEALLMYDNDKEKALAHFLNSPS